MTIIDQKYAELGGPSGLLGPALIPEMLASGGAFRTFQKGMIAWFPATGAHEVHGLIFKKWGRSAIKEDFWVSPQPIRVPQKEGAITFFSEA